VQLRTENNCNTVEHLQLNKCHITDVILIVYSLYTTLFGLTHAKMIKETDSIEQSPSSAANSRSASQKIPRLLWDTNVHYRVHKSPPMVPVLRNMNSVHTLPPYFIKIHLNVSYRENETS
jgi:hypothetical protein